MEMRISRKQTATTKCSITDRCRIKGIRFSIFFHALYSRPCCSSIILIMTLTAVKLKTGVYLIYRHRCMKHHFVAHKEQRPPAFENTSCLQLFRKMVFIYRGNHTKHSNAVACKRILTSNMFVYIVSTARFVVKYRSVTAMSMSFGNLHSR
jgi:uncharacterized membrane protein YozB (DUF420 family)